MPPWTANVVRPKACSGTGYWFTGQEGSSKAAIFVDPIKKASYSLKEINYSGGFPGSNCYAQDNSTIYLLSDYGTTTTTITDGVAEKTFTLPSVAGFSTGNLNVDSSAIGPGPNGEVAVVAIQNGNFFQMSLEKAQPSVKLTEMNIPSSVLGMAVSRGDSPDSAYSWILFKGPVDYNITKVRLTNGAPVVEFSQRIPAGVTPILSPFSGQGQDGVAVIAMSSQSRYMIHYFLAKDKSPVSGSRGNPISSTSTIEQPVFVSYPTNVITVDTQQKALALPIDVTVDPTTTDPSIPGYGKPPPENTNGVEPPPSSSKDNRLPVILGSIFGVLAVVAIVAGLLILRRRKMKRSKDLFPASRDDTLMPLGLYHQDRSHADAPRRFEQDLQRMGHIPGPGDMGVTGSQTRLMDYPPSSSSMHLEPTSAWNPSRSHLDETIPMEARLMHRSQDMTMPRGLAHSMSVSSTTSNFARRNVKSGKRFEEKVQLQVIRYEDQDAVTISPHGPIGRLVLGTYHIISDPKSARTSRAYGGRGTGIVRSGTVMIRRSRLDLKQASAGQGIQMERTPSPSPGTLMDDSSMLLTDAENQHTFETTTIKWYMTEVHWKREAALLKHLKSPIFVMELLESYCIPALQNRSSSYPFVNAMVACSSLLSDIGPVRTAHHARAILKSISAAVDWCHSRGVVHLNIQPGSFFLEDGVDPATSDAPWKLWDFTCARFIGEPIGSVGGGGGKGTGSEETQGQLSPPATHEQGTFSDTNATLSEQQYMERMNRIGGNPLPPMYTAPELLEAWRAGDTTFPAEAAMDIWSLGCVYYEILMGGQSLFATEADAWRLIGGWSNNEPWTSKNFRVAYPPSSSLTTSGSEGSSRSVSPGPSSSPLGQYVPVEVQDSMTPYERSRVLDSTGIIAMLLKDMLNANADERILLETIMEKIY